MKSNAEMSDNRFLGSISASSIRKLLPRSASTKRKTNPTRTKSRLDSENTPPIDPNIEVDKYPISPSIPKQSLSNPSIPQKQITRSDTQRDAIAPSDPPVKVVVRIRPVNGHEREGDPAVRKVSDDSVAVGDRKFTFDSVLDVKSNQEDVFQLVGVPLVKNALAGYNTSILAYGQTGSGKTYTMWGPPSAMVDSHLANSHQGIVPRIFQMLFSEIQQEQENSDGKQINYQCRCSFLEIYNEQIGDLLDPTQRNLEIKDDAKHGFYVENLTEEYVTSYDDITQILIKGLSSRKVGATSINSKSSRSHIVFTCVIESWSKGTSSTCFGSSKTSRISLVDLAGLERNKLDDDGRQCVKKEKSVKKSLSQLGHLVNFLAEGTKSGKPEVVPYRSSRLTHLLKESLGGNVKLAVICSISPDHKSNCETLSTLRFGQRVKSIRNEPVINEISEDDVNDLSDQIRQLKEELIRAKSSEYNSIGSNYGYTKSRSVRESVNQLRLSLNRSLILPHLDNECNEEVIVNEDDVRELRVQLDNLHSSCEENTKDVDDNKHSIQFSSVEESYDKDFTSEYYGSCLEEREIEETSLEKSRTELQQEESVSSVNFPSEPNTSRTIDTAFRRSISINSSLHSLALQEPALSESPKIGNNQRKSIIFASSTLLASENIVSESSKFDSGALRQSHKSIDHIRSSLRSSKIFPGPTESLAASLQRGLQIIDSHQQNSTSNKSSLAFSFEHLALKPCSTVDKANDSVQKLLEERPSSDGSSASFLCASCQRRCLETVDDEGNSNGTSAQAPKDVGKDLAEAIRREKELENICMEQAAKIDQLNLLVEQYKNNIKQNAIVEHSNTHCEDSQNELTHIDELKNENFHPLTDESKLLRWDDGENHNEEMTKEKCEIKEVREELDQKFSNTSFDKDEKEALLNEIQILRSKLQSYTDGPSKKSYERVRSSLLSQSIQMRKSGAFSQGNSEEELEKERQRWMEMESDWISLTDELRVDLEQRLHKLQELATQLIDLWNLMDTPEEDRSLFDHVTCNRSASVDEVTIPGALALDLIEQAEVEVERLDQLKASRMKEIAFKKQAELEDIFAHAHIEIDPEAAREKIMGLIDSGNVEPSELLADMDNQIVNAKEEALSRKDILEKVEKWMSACEEESWLEDYNRDDNRYNASRGAHLNLKRAEKARILVSKIPALVDTLVAKTRAWEEDRGVSFTYDGVPLLAMLDEYAMLRHDREEEKRRMRDQKKFHEQFNTEQESIFGSRPSPSPGRPSLGNKKVVGPRANGGANGTPNRRLSLNVHQNGGKSVSKDGKRDNTRPVAPVNYVAISKEDAASHVSGTEPVPTSP